MTKFGFDCWGGGVRRGVNVWRVPWRIICNVNSAVALQVSLAVSFYIEQWGFGAEWMVVGEKKQVTDRGCVVQVL